MDECDQFCIGAERSSDFDGIDLAEIVHSDIGHFQTNSLCQFPQWPQDRIVFNDRSDDMVACGQKPVQGEIEAVGGVECKHNSIGMLRPEQVCCSEAAARDNAL